MRISEKSHELYMRLEHPGEMISARIMSGTMLVLSPLISLMKGQIDTLDSLGFPGVAINSTILIRGAQSLAAAEYDFNFFCGSGSNTAAISAWPSVINSAYRVDARNS